MTAGCHSLSLRLGPAGTSTLHSFQVRSTWTDTTKLLCFMGKHRTRLRRHRGQCPHSCCGPCVYYVPVSLVPAVSEALPAGSHTQEQAKVASHPGDSILQVQTQPRRAPARTGHPPGPFGFLNRTSPLFPRRSLHIPLHGGRTERLSAQLAPGDSRKSGKEVSICSLAENEFCLIKLLTNCHF